MKSCEDTLFNFLYNAGFNINVRARYAIRTSIERRRSMRSDMTCDLDGHSMSNARFVIVCQSARVRDARTSFVEISCADRFAPKIGQASTPEEARVLLMKTVEEVNPSEISFTERAAMRTQCRKLAKFMKVVDDVST